MRSQTSEPTTPTLDTRGRLVQERLGRAVYTRRAGQGTGHDAARRHGRLEGAPGCLAAERLEQMIAREGDAAAHHHHLGIEDGQQVADADTEELRRIAHDFERELVAV